MVNTMRALTRKASCLLLALGLSFGVMPLTSHAETDFKVKGDMDIAFNWTEHMHLDDSQKGGDNFNTKQRLRLFMTARTSESTKLFALLRIRPHHWGDSATGYGLDSDGVNLRMRQLYIDWDDPKSPWHARLGIMPAATPGAAFFSSILFTTAAGASVDYTFNENVKAQLTWYRPYDDYLNDTAGGQGDNANLSDEMDMIYFALPLTFQEPNLNLTPWGMYARIGKDSGWWKHKNAYAKFDPKNAQAKHISMDSNANAWWGGLSGTAVLFDPVTLKFDFAYGDLKSDHNDYNYNSRGWYADFALDYKAEWGTPGLFGWYGSGSSYDSATKDNQFGYAPVVGTLDEGFNPTSFGFAAQAPIGAGEAVSRYAQGNWGIGAQIKDISFTEDLSHVVRLAYYRGTNDKKMATLPDVKRYKVSIFDNQFLTKGDDVVEVNVTHKYKIYENLVLSVDMGWLTLDRCEEWGSKEGREDAWQLVTSFKYSF